MSRIIDKNGAERIIHKTHLQGVVAWRRHCRVEKFIRFRGAREEPSHHRDEDADKDEAENLKEPRGIPKLFR
jgi:hypothetical protein